VLYFTGMLSSRIDIISITPFFSKKDIARTSAHELYTSHPSFLFQSSYAIQKNIYRLRNQTVSKLAEAPFPAGLVISGLRHSRHTAREAVRLPFPVQSRYIYSRVVADNSRVLLFCTHLPDVQEQ
jgi:hypothetical protein